MGCVGREASLWRGLERCFWSESQEGREWGRGGAPLLLQPHKQATSLLTVPSEDHRQEESGIQSVGLSPAPRCPTENCPPHEIRAFLGRVHGLFRGLGTSGAEARFPSRTEPKALPLSVSPHPLAVSKLLSPDDIRFKAYDAQRVSPLPSPGDQ